MAQCIACGKRGTFFSGTNTAEGWWCSRCANVGNINGNITNAVAYTSTTYPGVHLMGVFGTLAFTVPEQTWILNASASPYRDSAEEDIWGLGVPARHQTQPGTNIVVVYRRIQAIFTLYGIGCHTGTGNNNYRILRWNGHSFRATR
jgi:hypothetical protein